MLYYGPMIRTKHALILIALILFVLIGIALTAVLRPDGARGVGVSERMFNNSVESAADVSIALGQTTDEIRLALIAKLRAIGPHEEQPLPAFVMASEQPITENTTRTLTVARSDGSLAEVTLPRIGTGAAQRSELVTDIVGLSLGGELILNSAAYTYPTGAHAFVGFALDGFPIYTDDGSTDRDVCGGHTHDIVLDGKTQSAYHYHISAAEGRMLSCFSGTPINIGPFVN